MIARKSLSLDLEKATEIIENFLKCNGLKYEVKRYYTRYGLRLIKYKVGFLKKIKVINYEWGVEVVIP